MRAHSNGRDCEGNSALLENIQHRDVLKDIRQCLAQGLVAAANEISSRERTEDGAQLAFDAMRKDLGAIILVKSDDLFHRNTDCSRRRDDCTCARAHDEVESEAEIQRCFPAARSLLGEQAIEKGCGVYPTHASPIQAQYAIRSLTVIFAFRHLDLASLLHA